MSYRLNAHLFALPNSTDQLLVIAPVSASILKSMFTLWRVEIYIFFIINKRKRLVPKNQHDEGQEIGRRDYRLVDIDAALPTK